MEVVDLSVDDPEIKIKNDKKLKRRFNDLKKFVPFLNYLFELKLITNYKYQTLIDWLKIRHHSTPDKWHVISCESFVRKRYEKLKNTMDFPTHILEIFEGGTSIVISDSDEEDSTLPSTSSILREEENLTNDTQQKNEIVIAKQQSLTPNIEISQNKQDLHKKHSEFRTKDENSPLGGENGINKNNSSSEIIQKRKSSHHVKSNSSKEKKKKTANNPPDASVFDILPLNDFEKKDEKRLMLKSNRTLLPDNDSNRREKKKHKEVSKSNNINSSEIEEQTYQSLIKQKNKIMKLLRNEDKKKESSVCEEQKKMKLLRNEDKKKESSVCEEKCNLKKSELFQRRESVHSERKKSFKDSAITSIKSVLTKNPEIVAEVVNDSLGTKIVYDYTNVTNANSSKTISDINKQITHSKANIPMSHSEANMTKSQNETNESRGIDCKIQKKLNVKQNINPKPIETNNNSYTSGDAYRKAMCDQQINFKCHDSIQPSPHTKHKSSLLTQEKASKERSCSLSLHAHSSKIKNNSKNQYPEHKKQDKLENSSITNKKSQQISNSIEPRKINSKSSSTGSRDSILLLEPAKYKELKSHSTDFYINTTNTSITETREKLIEKKQTNFTKTVRTCSNSSKSKQSPAENSQVVLTSFSGDPKEIKNSKVSKQDELIKRSVHKNLKRSLDTDKVKLTSSGASSKIDHTNIKSRKDQDKDQILAVKLKDHDSKTKRDKTKKRNTNIYKDHDSTLNHRQVKKSLTKTQGIITDIESKNKSTDKTIKPKENFSTNLNVTKRKNSIERTNEINDKSEKKSKISTQSGKERFLTSKNPMKTVDRSLNLERNSSDQGKGTSKCTDKKNHLEDNSHRNQKASELSTVPEKKRKTSVQSNKSSTSKKSTNSPAKRYYREINNLTCTFKESLLPKTIGRRRCSSNWLNITDNDGDQLKNINVVLRPAPIQRRRQTCSELSNLKVVQNSKEKTREISERSEKKRTISTQSEKELIRTSEKHTKLVESGLNQERNPYCLSSSSEQGKGKSKDGSTKCTDNINHLQDISHRKQKRTKRKHSVESTHEINNLPEKKTKTSLQSNKNSTPEKQPPNSPAKLFNREFNNLTCTFKESLLPKTIGTRRCSSSWQNFIKNGNGKSKNMIVESTPAPIQRRRQTCSDGMPNLKLTIKRSCDRNEYYIPAIEQEKSSDETDEFDTYEHCLKNKEISNPGIREKTTENILENSVIPRVSPYKNSNSNSRENSTKPPGNNDSNMTFKSTKTCVLCNKNSIDLTNHYLVKHKTESYVSRLSSTDIQSLEQETNVAIPVCRNRFKMTCVFCKQMIVDSFENFYAHFSFHTGEYNFQCECCGIKKPYKEDIGSHQLRSRVCRNSKINKIHHHDSETKIIHLYICEICNFGNLNEVNLKNHLLKQHRQTSSELEKFKKYILVVKDDLKTKKKVHSAEYDIQNCERNDAHANEEAPLSAECEEPMNIQNILMNENNLCNGTLSSSSSKPNVSKIVGGKKDHDETIASNLSPEILLAEMHAPNNQIGITAGICFGELTSMSPESISVDIENRNKNVSHICSANEVFNHSNKRLLHDLQFTEPIIDLVNDPQSPETVETNSDTVIILHDSESLNSIEAYIQNTSESSCKSADSLVNTAIDNSNKKERKGSAQRILKKLLTSDTAAKNTSQLIEEHFEELPDSKPLHSVEEDIKNEVLRQRSKRLSLTIKDHKKRTTIDSSLIRKSLPEKNVGKLSPSKSTSDEDYLKKLNKSENTPVDKNSNTQVPNEFLNITSVDVQSQILTEKNKSSMIYHQYVKLDIQNCGLFKCLMKDCLYSTNLEEDFKVHWSKNHTVANQSRIYDCPYCINKSSSLENFTQHIWQHHSMSIYQCVKCSYRSVAPGNVILHRRIYHNDINTDKSIFKCCYLKAAERSKYRSSSKVIGENISSLKCPDCSYRFFAVASIKLHLRNTHPETFQKFSSLSLNNFACIHCNRVSNCKETMQVHLALQHPDEPVFVIERKLEPQDCENGVEDLTLVDMNIDVPESDIIVLEECKNPKIVNSDQNQETQNILEMETKQLETGNSQLPANPIVMAISAIYCRSPDNCVINQISKTSETTLFKSRTKSPLKLNKGSPLKLQKMEEIKLVSRTPTKTTDDCCSDLSQLAVSPDISDIQESEQNEESQTVSRTPTKTTDDCCSELSELAVSPDIREPEQNEDSQTVSRTPTKTTDDCCSELIELAVSPDIREPEQNEESQTVKEIFKINLEVQIDSLQVNSPRESDDPVPMLNDHAYLSSLENTQLKTITDGLDEVVVKEKQRIGLLLELLVENSGVHKSTLYRCPQCNSSFMHFELWLTHMKNKHTNIEDVNCPYCTSQFQYDFAESHFKSHLRHKYICYYCIGSFGSHEKIEEHFASYHDNCNTIQIPIASFYMVIKQDVIITDCTALLQHFAESIYSHLSTKIQRHTINEWRVELTDSVIEEMGIPLYKPEDQLFFKCLMKLCSYVGSDENSLNNHLVLHELPKAFECTHCMFVTTHPSWDSIKLHYLLHRSPSLHLCCVCKFVHYSNEGIIEHINNLHNSRDVPVLIFSKDDLNYKVSLSIFLPSNKINFTTSKDCFCCTKELGNANKYLQHLKTVHNLTLCTRCQICGKIILTHIDGEDHYKEDHKMETFKLKYEVLTTYLYNLIPLSRSPLTIEMHLKKEKHCGTTIESNRQKLTSLEIKEEILVKNEFQEDNETQSISINCLDTNQLLEESNVIKANSNQQPETVINTHEAENSTSIIEKNTSPSINKQNSPPYSNYQQVVSTGTISSSRGYGQPYTTTQNSSPTRQVNNSLSNTVHQFSSIPLAITNEVPLITQKNITKLMHVTNVQSSLQPSHTQCFVLSPQTQNAFAMQGPSGFQYTFPQETIANNSVLPSQRTNSNAIPTPDGRNVNTHLRALLSSQSQKKSTKKPQRRQSSTLSKKTQHEVIKEIQLTSGNVVVSIPPEAFEVSRAEVPGIVEEAHRIPVITTTKVQSNLQQLSILTANTPLTAGMHWARPLSTTSPQINQINERKYDEIVPICGICNFECTDFIHIQAHYETTHAARNECFYFYVDRKIGCMHCHFRGGMSSFPRHHTTFHRDKISLCYNVKDPRRCGICDNIFRYPSSSPSVNNYSLPPVCACPSVPQKTLADCLNLPMLDILREVGYRYYKYSCNVCRLPFQSQQQFLHHFSSVHNQNIHPRELKTKLKYYCFMCSSMTSYTIFDVIYHMLFSHLKQLSLTFSEKMEYYKKIRIAYPNGFLVSLDDLRHTEQFNEQTFKQDIYNFEAKYR